MTIEKVGVIGAGQMGNGIAHVCALAGYDVVLQDIDPDSLKKAIDTITYNLTRQVSRGIIKDEDKDKALKRIVPVNDVAAFSDVDLVIEAATEKEEVKRAIFAQLCPVLRADALISSNTSSISITRLAAATDRPEQFIGLHFMNPVPVMKLVELIRGIATDEETFKTAREFTNRLGKTT
ncbi:MAG TPA: 3-hydroxybutyryl-CoA dehydrogenase, partial [Alphaproteobacteria bacterium]|nr:3-hydroxybutyryl-CoA dehydrogenase [Alphaproteobacteria bacterium]